MAIAVREGYLSPVTMARPVWFLILFYCWNNMIIGMMGAAIICLLGILVLEQ
jgi:hypothetical protein